MPAILSQPPAIEPVTLSEAKAHLKVESSVDDTSVTRLIITARQYVEKQIDRVLIDQTWLVYSNSWPRDGEQSLIVSPVSSVVNLRTFSVDDIASVIDPSHYYFDQASDPQKLVLRTSRSWAMPGRKVNGIEIEVIAGYGAGGDAVPGPLRQAILMLVAHWYENRQPSCSGMPQESFLPALQTLLTPYKRIKL